MRAKPAAGLVACVVLAGIAAAIWIARDRGAGAAEAEPLRRSAFPLPRATPEERAAHFLGLLERAEKWTSGSWSAPVGRVLGRAGLFEGGDRSLDYLFAEERTKEYYQSTNRMLTVLQMLPDFPQVREHPRFEAFLRYWLDPDHCPPDTPGSQPAEEYRKRIFRIFFVRPPAWAEPYCKDEITRTQRYHDLRDVALAVLLNLGRTEPILEHWKDIPPNADEQQPLLKHFVLELMRVRAGEDQSPESREGARRLEPLARDALESGDLYARVNAASALLRLGNEDMVDRILAFSDAAAQEGDDDVRWSALQLLLEDRRDPRIRAICLERTNGPIDARDHVARTALKLLAFGWIEEPEVRARVWSYVRVVRFADPSALQWLARAPEEARAIEALLRDAIRGDDMEERMQAVRYATHPSNAVPEVMPDLFAVARATPADRGRTRYLNALVTMNFRPVVPLLRADLDDELEVLRRSAAANLLELDDEDGVRAVAERLRAGDRALLDPIVARAQARGAEGIRPVLLPALLHALRHAPGEDDRLRALFALRCYGRLDGVGEGLMDAYRREPSRRVADAIRETLEELALRASGEA